MLPYYVKNRDLPLVEKARNAYIATICLGLGLVLLIIHLLIYPQITGLLRQTGSAIPASLKLAAYATPLLIFSLLSAGLTYLARRPSGNPSRKVNPDAKDDLVNIQSRKRGLPAFGVSAVLTIIVIYLLLVYILPIYSLTSQT